MTIDPPLRVELVEVDEPVLSALVATATTDASADEVTPPLTEGPQWTKARIDWLFDMHRAARAGFDGPARQTTWAVLVDGAVAGQIRLKRVSAQETGSDPGPVGEIGMWLGRSVRGRGVGRRVVGLVIDRAAALGVVALRAETTTANGASQALLRAAGFLVVPGGEHGLIARLDLSEVVTQTPTA